MSMLSLGLHELVLLLALSIWNPVQQVGKPATAQELYAAMPANADFAVYVDIGSLGQHTLTALDRVAKMPPVKNDKRLAQAYQQVKGLITMRLGMAQAALGIDPFKSMNYISISGIMAKKQLLLVAKGKLPRNTLNLLLKRVQVLKKTKNNINGYEIYKAPRNMLPSLAWSPKSSRMYAGTHSLVIAALKGQNSTTIKGSLAQKMAQKHAKGALISAGFQLSGMMKMMVSSVAKGPFATLGKGLTALHVTASNKGADLSVWTNNAAVQYRFGLLLSGLGSLIMSSNYGVQGFIQIADVLVDPKLQSAPRIAKDLLRHKALVLNHFQKHFGPGKLSYKLTKGKSDVTLSLQGRAGLFTAAFALMPAALPAFAVIGMNARRNRARRYRRYPGKSATVRPYRGRPSHSTPPRKAPTPRKAPAQPVPVKKDPAKKAPAKKAPARRAP